MTRHKKHGIKLRSMYQWHRYIGVSVAVFILILAMVILIVVSAKKGGKRRNKVNGRKKK